MKGGWPEGPGGFRPRTSAPSSVICSANATFPPVGGRLRVAERGGPYSDAGSSLSVGAGDPYPFCLASFDISP